MSAWIRIFGGFAVQAALILFGAISMLVFARDGFQVFVHDAFNWLIVLGETILGAIFEQPAIRQAIEKLLSGLQMWLADLGISVDLVLQSHWKHAFVLLSLAFCGYAHAFKDFVVRPATSIFRYANGFVSAFLGGLMAGTVHLAHPGVLVWPIAAFSLFRGLNASWRGAFGERSLPARRLAALMAALWLGGAGALAAYVLGLANTDVFPGESPSPGLQFVALAVAGAGVWATVFGFGVPQNAVAQHENAGKLTPRLIDDPGRRMGLRVLATLGLAALVAGLGHAAWGIAREPHAGSPETPSGVFRDCPECPEMVAIRAGDFTMGTTDAQANQLRASGPRNESRSLSDARRSLLGRSEESESDERPARNIAVPAFAMARTEVTIAEFDAFIEATGYRPSGVCWGLQGDTLGFYERISWRHPGYDQGPDHPVVCVTWWDAQAYARWLSLRTGKAYRLPSEAEWEYAARAGTEALYFWGDDADAGCAFMNGADETVRRVFPNETTVNCDDGALYTAPVASYGPNAFGLFDTTGNVWEWVQDCYGAYDPGRADSTAVVRPDCPFRVLRGGSWGMSSRNLRSADRNWNYLAYRGIYLGFRVARTL